jgi:Flp pilus assembly protein TadD
VVFELVRRGDRRQAILVLEHWVGANPTDRDLLLSLARLLNEAGRSDDAIKRYRQILALRSRER